MRGNFTVPGWYRTHKANRLHWFDEPGKPLCNKKILGTTDHPTPTSVVIEQTWSNMTKLSGGCVQCIKKLKDRAQQEENFEKARQSRETPKLTHTPGPWLIHPQLVDEFSIFNQTGTIHICDVHNEYDALLIRTAPAMLAVCKDLEKILNHFIHITPTGEFRNRLCDLNIKLGEAIFPNS